VPPLAGRLLEENQCHPLSTPQPQPGLRDRRNTRLRGDPGGRDMAMAAFARSGRSGQEETRRPALTPSTLPTTLQDHVKMTQNVGNPKLTGDPTSLLDGARRKEMTTGWWLRWFSRLSHGSKELLGG